MKILLICYEFRSGRAGYKAAPIVFKKGNIFMLTTWRRVSEWRCRSVIINLSTGCRPMKSFMLRLFLPLLKETQYQLHRWLCVMHNRCGSFEVTDIIILTSIIFLSCFSVISCLLQMCYNFRAFQPPTPPLKFIPPPALCTGINLPNIGITFVSL